MDSTGSVHMQAIPSESHSGSRFGVTSFSIGEHPGIGGWIICTGPSEEINVCRIISGTSGCVYYYNFLQARSCLVHLASCWKYIRRSS